MTQDLIAKYKLRLEAHRVPMANGSHELLTFGEGRITCHAVFIEVTYQSQILPDGSEIATVNGILRAKKSCDFAIFQGIRSWRCEPCKKPPLQLWRGAVAVQSQSPKFVELNARSFWTETKIVPEGPVIERWWALDEELEVEEDE
ncbi:hypothetical protein RKE29_02515 [Streptomyces sp. B1866]|uniref:hypothetical protein n=1 Tax=Streptomyces sp. B1866 TaxID=3075431 RepID=UPI00288C8123|nr:hypothetical protein [Streptomyces sp. B1866]MDT3395531.1 hypothetical protein [Streptomyces sp. B1866]